MGFLYSQSESCVCLLVTDSDMLSVSVGLVSRPAYDLKAKDLNQGQDLQAQQG